MSLRVRALHDFFAENESELSLKKGDIVVVLNSEDEGWWEGECGGQRGLFPANYCEVIPNSPPAGPRPPAPRAPASTQPAKAPSGPAATASTAAPQKTGIARDAAVRVHDDAKAGVKPNVPKAKQSKTKFGLWASNMAKITGFTMIVMGFCGISWYVEYNSKKEYDLYGAIYGILVGAGILGYEYLYGDERKPLRVPVRAIVYAGLSVFCFFTPPLYFCGGFLVAISIVQMVAVIMNESYDKPPEAVARKKDDGVLADATGVVDAIVQYATMIREQNKVGVLIFIGVYIAANLFLFIYTVIEWHDINLSLPKDDRLSSIGPFAKGFGKMLDLNCSLILVPVLRSVIRLLYNKSTADQGCFAKTLRFILLFIPLDRALSFHKLIAKVIVFAAFGHTIVHFINYSLRSTQTVAVFGLWPWYSGGIICFAMLMIYSAAFDNVHRGQFEIFWYNHHWFVVFFAMILTHGKGGWQPNFWPYFIGPGVLYVLERILRIYRAKQPVVVLSVTFMRPSVLSLEFAKEGVFSEPYKEGQYIFLQCPAASRIQWHPFTISSAPDEKTVTVHIKVLEPGSWTHTVMQYFTQMGPKQSWFPLDRQGPQGKVRGKILGPDGNVMMSIDGPHSAPTQHMTEYSVAMIIGAGIGVTPVAATLKSIVFHRWKYFIGQCFPDHAYFMWVCSYSDIDSFRWLIRILKNAQDEMCHMRANSPQQMATKSFEVHIWITSVPKDARPVDLVVDDDVGFWGVPREDDKVEKMRAPFGEEDIYRSMKYPDKHKQLGDIHIYSGRPDWRPRFDQVALKHPKGDVGVAFCGNPFISKDLAKQCHIASHKRDGLFVLHKENF